MNSRVFVGSMRILDCWGDAWLFEGEVDETGQPFGECHAVREEDINRKTQRTYQGTCINGVFEGLGKTVFHLLSVSDS